MDIEALREAIEYDPQTGVCSWKRRPTHHFKNERAAKVWNAQHSGKKVGYIHRRAGGKAYLKFTIFNRSEFVHRAIVMLVFGFVPDEVDHQDGNGTNNKLDNLRPTDRLGNSKNVRQRAGRSLPVGIVFRFGKYEARIQSAGSIHYLGRFERLKDATHARSVANGKFGFHSNHGQVRPSYA